MNARLQVREHLLARKIKPFGTYREIPFGPHERVSCEGAEKLREALFAKCPQIAERLGLTMLSSFPPL
jgi:hypothetical protein